ncbi:MAG TPA: hypothetical protein VHF69_05435 [Candidatus Synoicihabitans sp.]|nr:hypothetical protein [Candidatus Synoicihabitans sp.]
MNRGNLLQRLGDRTQGHAAIESYDQAISLFTASSHPSAPASLAAAWMNRGLALLRRDGDRRSEAISSFATARARYAALPLDANPAHRCNAAAAALNHASALLQTRDLHLRATAREAAEAALVLAEPLNNRDEAAAGITLAATELWCAATRGEWSGESARACEQRHTASDRLDDALALARTWEARQPGAWLTAGRATFRVAVAFYLAQLPQFVPELLAENVDPRRAPSSWTSDHDIRAIAAEAAESAWHHVQNERIRHATTSPATLHAQAEELERVLTLLRVGAPAAA